MGKLDTRSGMTLGISCVCTCLATSENVAPIFSWEYAVDVSRHMLSCFAHEPVRFSVLHLQDTFWKPSSAFRT